LFWNFRLFDISLYMSEVLEVGGTMKITVMCLSRGSVSYEEDLLDEDVRRVVLSIEVYLYISWNSL